MHWILRMQRHRKAEAVEIPQHALSCTTSMASIAQSCSTPAQLPHLPSQPSLSSLEQPAVISRHVTENFDPVGKGAENEAILGGALPHSWFCTGVATNDAIENHLGMPNHEVVKIAADVVKDIDTDIFREKVGLLQCVSDVFSDVIVDIYVPG